MQVIISHIFLFFRHHLIIWITVFESPATLLKSKFTIQLNIFTESPFYQIIRKHKYKVVIHKKSKFTIPAVLVYDLS